MINVAALKHRKINTEMCRGVSGKAGNLSLKRQGKFVQEYRGELL